MSLAIDLIIAGKESSDYNGGAVPGMIAELMNIPFINACIGLEIENKARKDWTVMANAAAVVYLNKRQEN